MTLTVLSVPRISVSSPPPVQHIADPFSPFTGCSGFTISVSEEEEDGPRPPYLSTPTTLKHLSPLCPPEVPVKGQGIERERFDMLLKASRERTMALGQKKSPDLRKEVAVKTHRSKQVERRVRFLLKVQQLPSPTAANLPKTPPDSPALLHFSLPSPGLDSPLAMYEDFESGCLSTESWTEQVDFRLPADYLPLQSKPIPKKPSISHLSTPKNGKSLPSLDQISARLTTKHMSGAHEVSRCSLSFPQQNEQSEWLQGRASPPPVTVGRLQMPGLRVRSSSLPLQEERAYAAPSSPKTPELVVTTTVVPRTVSTPRNLTEANVEAFSRASMLNTLSRRSQLDHQLNSDKNNDAQERSRRRRSAPGELLVRERSEFKHPVLSLRGGF